MEEEIIMELINIEEQHINNTLTILILIYLHSKIKFYYKNY